MLRLFSLLPKQITKRLVLGLALLRNPFSLGVRVIVTDENGRVLLVRHKYLPGWYLPGGGVEKGEILVETAKRELREEAGVKALGDPKLLGMFLNREGFGRDHIGLFEVKVWVAEANHLKPNAEILEARFFPPASLPADMTRATAARLREYFASPPASEQGGYW